MRLSDLLGAEVVDLAGNKIGRVHEVRAVQAGPLQGAFGAALTIEGLIVGRGSFGTRLGLDRPDADSPALLRVIFEGLKGERLFIPWDKLAAISERRVIAVASAEELGPPRSLAAREDSDAPSSS